MAEWQNCTQCNWPHGKYQHSAWCIPEQARRAMPEHTERVQALSITIDASTLGKRDIPTARIVADYGI